jgi:uncharacterized membrane protein
MEIALVLANANFIGNLRNQAYNCTATGMNENDRQELERLKSQQTVLGAKLSELRALSFEIREQIARLEVRLRTSETPSLPAQLLEKKEETKLVETKYQPPPVTQQPPPLGETKAIEPPVYAEDWVKPVQQTELPAAPKEVIPPAIETKAPLLEPALAKENEAEIFQPETPPKIFTPLPPQLPSAAEKAPLELRLGTFWLVRIGIVMVLTALVFLANYAYKTWIVDMGPAAKVGLLYFAGAALLGVGGWLYRKYEALKNYAQVLIAGGLAEVYFTTYAAHHLSFLKVIESPVLDAVLLLIWAGIIVAIADWKKSEVMALLAIVLSYYDAIITKVGLFTLSSNLILAAAAVVFLVRNRWAATSLASLIATYAGYAFWRFLGPRGWHGAGAEEGLWTGVFFLMCYWLIFTAAGFLCRDWPLAPGSGKGKPESRLAFLSLNNAAFFGQFMLTMLQVQHGGFWKLALIFGAVLTAMAILSRRMLPNEPLVRNGYLTQGIFLVTLGFITKLSGTDLALVLAVESAVLLVMSRLLRNQVLRFGSVICGVLATGWAVSSILQSEPFNKSGLIVGTASGLFLIFNSWWVLRKPWPVDAGTNTDPSRAQQTSKADQDAECIVFTILGLLIWGGTTLRNTSFEWLGLTLGVESVLFLLAKRWLPLLRFGSYVYASLGTLVGLAFLLEQLDHSAISGRLGLFPNALFGFLMIFNALWAKRSSKDDTWSHAVPEWLFSVLALAAWLGTTASFVPTQWLAPVLAFEALIFSLQLKWVRLPAVAFFGQLFLVIAQGQCAVLLGQDAPSLVREMAEASKALPWWNPAIIIAITVGLSHWWKHNRKKFQDVRAGTNTGFSKLCEILYAFATVCLLFVWLHLHFSPDTWLAFVCVLALILTAYGIVARLWWIAAFGQLFLVVSILEFFKQVPDHAPLDTALKFFALTPIVSLWVFSLVFFAWVQRKQTSQDPLPAALKSVGIFYRVAAAVLAIFWIFEYINPANRVWVFALVGGLFFLWCLWKRNSEAIAFSLVFTGIGFVQYWHAMHSPERVVYWPNLLAILGLLFQQQLARRTLRGESPRMKEKFPATLNGMPEALHTVIILLGGCSLWLFAAQWVRLHSGTGFFLTAVWAAVAFVIFTAGFLLRERIYRWLGLGILAVALGRVVVVDVWQLETPYRILSFMALGVVLLVLGFIYTKYQEKIRQWL